MSEKRRKESEEGTGRKYKREKEREYQDFKSLFVLSILVTKTREL
jgi:hypothetical protein